MIERSESFPADGPVELELHVGSGALLVRLGRGGDTDGGVVTDGGGDREAEAGGIQVRVSEGGGVGWRRGLEEVLSSLGVSTARVDPAEDAPSLDAVAATQVEYSADRARLVLRTPQSGPGRAAPLQVTVVAPVGSRVRARAGSASVTITGPAGAVDVDAGSGDVTVDAVDEAVRLRTGSGELRTGHLRAGGSLRTGSGELAVDATSGALDVVTGSGDLRLGIAAGVLAELDVRSGSGRARSELAVSPGTPSDGNPVLVTARTGSGDVLVHPAR